MFSYEGRNALVTGAGRGIGRAIALAFAAQGADLALASRSVDELGAVAEEVRALGRVAHVLPTDLAERGQAVTLVDRALEAMGTLDVLVNNAGGGAVRGAFGPLEATTDAGFDHIYQLNVHSPLFASLRFVEHLRATSRPGCILNIVSIDATFPAPTEGLYGSAKAALVNLTSTMAVECGKDGIRVNAIAPALVDTKLVSRAIPTEEHRADRASLYPINRIGQPEDIAAAAVFLCSNEAGWVSGETLLVAGGQKATSDVFRWLRRVNDVPESMRI